METMKAIRVDHFGGPETVKLEQIPKPQPKAGQILVRVHATGVNPIDWKLREGMFRELPVPFTPGGDFAGLVESFGEGVDGFKRGDEVYGCAPGSVGAEAEYLLVPPTHVAHKPKALTFVKAASVPLAAMTAWQGLFQHGLLEEGQTVLVLGASGGVGSFAVQFARQAGARVIGTASKENVDRVRALGTHRVVDYKSERIEDAAADVDLCLDLVGGEFQSRALALVKSGGRFVSTVRSPDQEKAKGRNVHALMFRMKPEADQLRSISRMVDAGHLRVDVAKVLPLEQAAQAEELNRKQEVDGKIVLRVGSE